MCCNISGTTGCDFLGSILQKPSQLYLDRLTMIRIPKCCGAFFFEYETPKVVSIQNVPLGILRVVLQLLVIAFVVVFQLWYSQGYQGGITERPPDRASEDCMKWLFEQGSAKRRVPGCVNAAGRSGRSGKQQQEQNSPYLGPTFFAEPCTCW